MNTELTEAQRADIRKMARESGDPDKEGVLTNFDRDILGANRVRIDIPLRDTVMLAKHLDVLAGAIDRCRVILSYKQRDERATLLATRGLIRDAHKKINAYKRMRRD